MEVKTLKIIKWLIFLISLYFAKNINGENYLNQTSLKPKYEINFFMLNKPDKSSPQVQNIMVLKREYELNDKIDKLEEKLELIDYKLKELKCNIVARGCDYLKGCKSGVYQINNLEISNNPFLASCDLETLGGGWTIIQRRQDGSEDFYRNWSEYKNGFGNIINEFFIGLNKLHALTSLEKPQELYIMLEDINGEKGYARYGIFKIGSESTDYMLTVGDYSGNTIDSLEYHNGSKFSTKDRDNDISSQNCAEIFKGAWWYAECGFSNLNGQYSKDKTSTHENILWGFNRPNTLKFVQMMIRPKEN